MPQFRVLVSSIYEPDADAAVAIPHEDTWDLAKQGADWLRTQAEQGGNPDGLRYQAVASDHRKPYEGKVQKS